MGRSWRLRQAPDQRFDYGKPLLELARSRPGPGTTAITRTHRRGQGARHTPRLRGDGRGRRDQKNGRKKEGGAFHMPPSSGNFEDSGSGSHMNGDPTLQSVTPWSRQTRRPCGRLSRYFLDDRADFILESDGVRPVNPGDDVRTTTRSTVGRLRNWPSLPSSSTNVTPEEPATWPYSSFTRATIRLP